MKPLKSESPLGANPSQPPLHRGGACLTLPLLRGRACEGAWRGFGSRGFYRLLTALIFSCIITTAHAANLGRLFFTPAQRAQLDYAHARNAPTEGGSSPFVTVNGIVQKQGGARTVWVNGVSQSAGNSGERNPAAQTISVPGKSRPVKLKVGDKILLDQPAPATQATPVE